MLDDKMVKNSEKRNMHVITLLDYIDSFIHRSRLKISD